MKSNNSRTRFNYIGTENKTDGILRTKSSHKEIVLNNKIIDQISFYNYDGNLIFCEKELDTAK